MRRMTTHKKSTLAIVCNYDDNSCGIAAYARLREKSFSEYFDITMFDLQSSALMRSTERVAAADLHIDQICANIGTFDFVSVDLEFGIWGSNLESCESRFLRCCTAARRLLLTVHRVDINGAKSGPFALAQARIFLEIARRSSDRPYHIIAHSEDEAQILRSTHGFAEVSSHPLAFVTAAEKAALRRAANPAEWKRKLGFEESAIVVGVFGAISGYKDNKTVIKAFQYLPDEYKLLFVGGAHPFSIKPFQADENILVMLQTIAEAAAASPGLEARVRFSGILEDTAFRQLMQNCDFVIVPYHDAGQQASGVASMAFELGKCIVATHTMLFLRYRHLYGESFEMFDVGNYLELRDRLMFFGPDRVERMKTASNLYTPETMAAMVSQIAAEMTRDGFQNHCNLSGITGLVHSLQSSTPDQLASASSETLSNDVVHLRKAYAEAIAVQERLKTELAIARRRLTPANVLEFSRRKLSPSVRRLRSIYQRAVRGVRVPRFNTILDDTARQHYERAIRVLWLLAPDVMTRKIARANVQQGFMLAAVEQLARRRKQTRMLCVGSFEDTAAIALQSLGYNVEAIDPAVNMDLRAFCEAHPELRGTYDIVFSTSVIEHVRDDEAFVADIASMLAPGGYAVLTCDYDNHWLPGRPKPSTDVRLYTEKDMTRLIRAMGDVDLVDEPDWNKHHLDFTIWEAGVEMRYAFASFVVRRKLASGA